MFSKSVFSLLIFTVSSIYFTSFKSYEEIDHPADSPKEFLAYLSHFEKVEIPYQVEIDAFPTETTNAKVKSKIKTVVKENKAQKYLAKSPFIPGMSKGMFSRVGPPIITPIARFYPKDNVIAVIYKSQPRFGGNYTTYKMITYDFNGNILNEEEEQMDVSFNLGSSDYDTVSTFTIEEGGIIVRTNYEKIYKFNVEKKGYDDNEIVEYKLVNSELFQISNKGFVNELAPDSKLSKA